MSYEKYLLNFEIFDSLSSFSFEKARFFSAGMVETQSQEYEQHTKLKLGEFIYGEERQPVFCHTRTEKDTADLGRLSLAAHPRT